MPLRGSWRAQGAQPKGGAIFVRRSRAVEWDTTAPPVGRLRAPRWTRVSPDLTRDPFASGARGRIIRHAARRSRPHQTSNRTRSIMLCMRNGGFDDKYRPRGYGRTRLRDCVALFNLTLASRLNHDKHNSTRQVFLTTRDTVFVYNRNTAQMRDEANVMKYVNTKDSTLIPTVINSDRNCVEMEKIQGQSLKDASLPPLKLLRLLNDTFTRASRIGLRHFHTGNLNNYFITATNRVYIIDLEQSMITESVDIFACSMCLLNHKAFHRSTIPFECRRNHLCVDTFCGCLPNTPAVL